MCGIVGLFLKNEELQPRIGRYFGPMLREMTSRGPDSAGVAIYRNPAPDGSVKFSLAHRDSQFDWKHLQGKLAKDLSCDVEVNRIHNHAVLVTNAEEKAVLDWLKGNCPGVRVVGSGRTVEIYKEVGLPETIYNWFDLNQASGSHMIGHTRMATESAVVTAGSHPFATGADLCLVHNGSLSNHNRLRQRLIREGLEFYTDNDSEVAAAYITARLRQGDTLNQALEACLSDLDGFYTFCVGTEKGFAVLRDPIACKHAVLAETDDWVAMATEYRAIATLPGSEHATIWEPNPKTIYSWGEGEGTVH